MPPHGHSSLPGQHCRPWSCFLEGGPRRGRLIAQPGVKTIVGFGPVLAGFVSGAPEGPQSPPDHLMGKERGKSLMSVMEGEVCLHTGGGALDPGGSGRGWG